MSEQKIKDTVPALLSWYELHARLLPWRQNPTPYRVWISEIMLQQTRIEAVIPHYHAFVTRMPNLRALAEIEETELLKFWEGLGYYSRARNLQKAAKTVLANGKEDLPETYAELLKLPGIGEYTAGAVASICFNECVPAVDGNVLRVLARLTGDDTDVLSPEGKKKFTALAKRLVPRDAAGKFNQAVMELGETVCLPNTAPKCEKCPFSEVCVAHRKGSAAELPVRKKAKKRKIELRTVLVLKTNETPARFLIHKRPQKGLLANLFEYPNVDGTLTEEKTQAFLANMGVKVNALHELETAKHVFTHIEWHMSGYFAIIETPKALPDGYCLATKEEMAQRYAIPSAFRAFTKFINSKL